MEAIELVRLFKAVANKRRLEILRLLITEGEKSVSGVSEHLGISYVSASRHLLQLERVGLLKNRQQSLWVYYSINNMPSESCREILELVKQRI